MPFTAGCATLLEGRMVDAADLLEEFWDQSVTVPVWRVMAAPVVTHALVASGRLHVADEVVGVSGALLTEMERAPNLAASLDLARGQVALAHDDTEAAERAGARAMQAAGAAGLCLATVDATDLLAAAAERRGDATVAARLRDQAASERRALGYRFCLITAT